MTRNREGGKAVRVLVRKAQALNNSHSEKFPVFRVKNVLKVILAQVAEVVNTAGRFISGGYNENAGAAERFRRFHGVDTVCGLDRVGAAHIAGFLRLALNVISALKQQLHLMEQTPLAFVRCLFARVTDQIQLGLALGSVPQSILVQKLHCVVIWHVHDLSFPFVVIHEHH